MKITLHFITILVISLLFVLITFAFPFRQISDFQQYEAAARDISQYIKGGLLPILYAPLLKIGISSHIAALFINLTSFLLLSSIFPKEKWWQNVILFLIGLTWSAWAPILNSDIPATSFIISGSVLFLKDRKICGFILFTAGLTFRIETFLLALALLFFFLISHRKFVISKNLIISLSASLLFSLIICFILSIQSTEKQAIASQQRFAIYNGILATEPGPTCGEITPATKSAVFSDLDKPIFSILIFPPDSFEIITCKWRKLLMYGASASLWLVYANDSSVIYLLESIATHFLKIICCFLFVIKPKRDLRYLSAVVLLLSFFGIHTFLEIQPRYMIPSLTSALVLLTFMSTSKETTETGNLPSM